MKKIKAIALHPSQYQLATDLANNWSDDLNNVFFVASRLAAESDRRDLQMKNLEKIVGKACLLYLVMRNSLKKLPDLPKRYGQG